MQKQLAIWSLVRNSIREKVDVMLLYVLESSGSSPGRGGFFMAVNANGQMKGSIGGGIMEHKFVELAKIRLLEGSNTVSIHKQVHDKLAPANQSGMICSGEQTVLLYKIKPGELEIVNEIICACEENKIGFLHLSNAGIKFNNIPGVIGTSLIMDDDYLDWHYTEQVGYINHLYIVGGGHCALALSKTMQYMDFYIHLIDDRTALNTFEENAYANEKKIVENYSVVENMIKSGMNIYVVIMTMGYRTDDLAIRALKGKKFKYFGVLGSTKKMEKMFADYRREGMEEAWLSTISAPAGLPIKSQTPEEIAISIAGEIIKVKNSV